MNRLSGEDRLLHWLRTRLEEPLIGDDAAVLPAGEPFAVTVDSQIEGVHFPAWLDASTLARRLLAVNLSDLAAMGASPAYAFLALSAAPGFDHERFFLSLAAACRPHRLRLAGGDLAKSPHGTIATLTLLGTKPEENRWLRRDGAVPGHGLWLGGTVGESAAGRLLIDRGARLTRSKVELPEALRGLAGAARNAVRRHLLPEPQLALGAWLGEQKEGAPIAAMDVSDGVARDLHRLCRASAVGAEIDAAALPLSDRFEDLCKRIEADPLTLALTGGEDYVLLFTLPAGLSPPASFACRRIGTITKRQKVALIQDGVSRKLADRGWDHLL
ncbi:MAG TPA: thiamine-phosphate kinase [Thermoanaerobaculia bacterium]|nr:thiamine-phosphate kinase [Thermoanaerobaculia bacterium]